MSWRFALKLLALLPIPAAVLAANLAVDPAHLFEGGGYEAGLARALLAGANVADVSINYDHRLLQKHLIGGLTARPDVVALGSSRAFEIRGALFPGKRFLNNSVGLVTLEDYLAIYGMYRQRGLQPGTLILGLEPWLLNAKHGIQLWKSLQAEARAGEAALADAAPPAWWATSPVPAKWWEAASPAYFQASVKAAALQALGQGGTPPKAHAFRLTAAPFQERTRVLLADNSLIYDAPFRARPPAKVRYSAYYHFTHPKTVDELKDFAALDPAATKRLEAFVRRVRADGVRLAFFLAPFHPAAWAAAMKDPRYQAIATAQAYFERLAKAEGVPVLGSYDPAAAGAGDGDFYDGLHAREAAVARIIRAQGPKLAARPAAPG